VALILAGGDLLGGPVGPVILFLLLLGFGAGLGLIFLLIRIAKWNGDRINRKRSAIDDPRPSEEITPGDEF
jgi:hypothetical protein